VGEPPNLGAHEADRLPRQHPARGPIVDESRPAGGPCQQKGRSRAAAVDVFSVEAAAGSIIPSRKLDNMVLTPASFGYVTEEGFSLALQPDGRKAIDGLVQGRGRSEDMA